MPEVTLADDFGRSISKVISDNNYRINLEIGSWDGAGSTQCIIDGMKKLEPNGYNALLQCIEINPDRF